MWQKIVQAVGILGQLSCSFSSVIPIQAVALAEEPHVLYFPLILQ